MNRNPVLEGAGVLFLIVFVMWLANAKGYSNGEMVAIGIIGVILLFGFLVLRALKRVGDPREPQQATPPTAAPPPGFYTHPSGETRWWNGAIWTEHKQP